MKKNLALLGGDPVITEKAPETLFRWPIITEEDEAAALEVIRNNSFSGIDITEKFQEEFCAWIGSKYGVCYCNGTLSIAAAMFAIGLGAGDEIICPTKTYWGSIAQTVTFGATPVFCNITDMLSIDPADIERCITEKTKAILVVHYLAYPADMDAIMAIAKKHNLKVIEDVSHAQGGMYKGKRLGTFGDVAAMSLMSGKSFAAGELGILITDNRAYYERAIAYAHYERNNKNYITESTDLHAYSGIALGGVKGRANQLCSAMARVQLKYYDERCKEIRKAMNYFWDLLDGVPGLGAIRVNEEEGTTMGGWYCPHGAYYPEQLGGLTVGKFCEAVRAEIGGDTCWAGGNYCLHTHEAFHTFDFNHIGKPSRMAYNDRDVVAEDALCNPSLEKYCFSIPWFKHMDKEWIERYAAAYRKVAENYRELLEVDDGKNITANGRWFGTSNE